MVSMVSLSGRAFTYSQCIYIYSDFDRICIILISFTIHDTAVIIITINAVLVQRDHSTVLELYRVQKRSIYCNSSRHGN